MAKVCETIGTIIYGLAIVMLCACIRDHDIYFMNEQFTAITLTVIGTVLVLGIIIFVIGATKQETKKILNYVKQTNDTVCRTKWLVEKMYSELNKSIKDEEQDENVWVADISSDNLTEELRR